MCEDHSRQSGAILNVHAIMPRSCANGPGLRTTIWFQGCTLGCPDCCNPRTHTHADTWLVPTEGIIRQIAAMKTELEGVTITGGEPLQQSQGLERLLSGIKQTTRLSTLLFSGYTISEILHMESGRHLLDLVDVLVAGRYKHTLYFGRGLRGSSNQSIHLLTDRYSRREIDGVPAAEVRINMNGDIQITGVAPVRVVP